MVWAEMLFEEIQHATWRLSWLSERTDSSNSESLCHCDVSHQVLAQSDTVWEEMSFEEFQEGRHGSHPRNRNGTILVCHCDATI